MSTQEPDTVQTSFLQGLSAKVGSIDVFQEGDRIGVKREIESAGEEDGLASPISSSIRTTRNQLNEDNHDTRFDLFDAMLDLDPELSGAVNAIAQSASDFDVVSPVDEPSSEGETALEECQELVEKLHARMVAIDILRNLIRYGNDISKKNYNREEGITSIQSLPVKSVTIVDDRDDLFTATGTAGSPSELFSSLFQASEEDEEMLETQDLNEVFSRDAYVLNETSDSSDPSIIEPYNTLHFSIDARSNWFEDQVGRETYGVWGKSRLEPLTFTIQTKYNTLTNKVAMDDKLLAREIYYIDTAELFGDINDFEERKKKAQNYADQLRSMIEGLGPDERPMLPSEVEVEVIGPEGKAIDQQPFLEQLNNGIAAALTFPMAGLGRGTTSVKAGEEISSLWAENNIKNLRRTVTRGFRELFRDHLKLLHPEWVENFDEASNLGDMKLSSDIEVPTLSYEPFKEEDMTEKARQIKLLYTTGTASMPERREIFGGLSNDEESLESVREEFQEVPGPSEPEGGGASPSPAESNADDAGGGEAFAESQPEEEEGDNGE